MPEGNNLGCLNLPEEALELFSQAVKPVPVRIQVHLADAALFELQFNIQDLNKPDVDMHKVVGASLAALLDQIQVLNLVQNKNQN